MPRIHRYNFRLRIFQSQNYSNFRNSLRKRPVITSLNACIGGAVTAHGDDDTAAHQMVFMLHHTFGAAFLVHDFFIRPGVIMLCHDMLAREDALII